jgi:ABC-2 type transport system permease protein
LTETKHAFTTLQDVGLGLVMGPIFLVILILTSGRSIGGLPNNLALDIAAFAVPGVLGGMIGFGGVMSAAYWLAADREDGTLLRAKTLPQGLAAYLTARVITVSTETVAGMLIVLVPGLFLFEGLGTSDPGGWLMLVVVTGFGLAATLPWGAILGAALKTPRTVSSFGFIPIVAFSAISGFFAPLSVWPEWVRIVAQIFPFYWLGLGMRSALLPEAAVALEITGSWRVWPMLGILAGWTVVGLVIAPVVLRRVARSESGARLDARRQDAMQRIG